RIPPGTFHRSVSDPDGSVVLNQAVRAATTTLEHEFRVYSSADIPRLRWATSRGGVVPQMHGFKGPICRAA
ncbi:MAG TPA: hypothetical protein V6D19_07705, partial [Stenomitos sp.]